MKLLSWITTIAFSVLSLRCGGSEIAANKTNINAPLANSANGNANTNAPPTEAGFELPSPKPVEQGKTHSLTGISVTVPADWKKIDAKEGFMKFQSPDQITLAVRQSYDLQDGDMMTTLIRYRTADPTYKGKMQAIEGTLGILSLNETSTTG